MTSEAGQEFRTERLDKLRKIIYHVSSTLNSSLKTTLYSCPIHVKKHQQCIATGIE